MTLDKIYQAAFTLKGVARETSLLRAPLINPESDVYLKTENLQVTGSFKVRGAYNKISRLSPEEKRGGHRLFRREPCAGRRPRCGEERNQGTHLYPGRRAYLESRSNAQLRR